MPEPNQQHAEILVATTWECNLRCRYCFVDRGGAARRQGRMSPALARRVIDALDQGLTRVESISVHLYGGEPLLNLPAARAMLGRARRKKPGRFSFAVTTNGTCRSPAALELLGAGGFEVVLSVDGPPEVHDRCRRTLRNRPTHADVMRFLRALRRRTRCRVRGSAVVRSGWSLARASRYLRSLPVDTIKAQAVRGPEGTWGLLSPCERDAYGRDLEAVGRRVVRDLEAGKVPQDDRFSSRVLQLLAGARRTAFCGAGETAFGIHPNGDVSPCVLMSAEECRLGHVEEDPRVWVEAGARWKRSQRRRPECRECSALDLCGGGCPAILPICGRDECELCRKNCDVARAIFDRFHSRPEVLLLLAGIT